MATWQEMYDVAQELEDAIQSGTIGPHPQLVGKIESLTLRAKSLDERVKNDADALLKTASSFFGSLGAQLSSEQAKKKKTDLMRHLSGIRVVAAKMKRE